MTVEQNNHLDKIDINKDGEIDKKEISKLGNVLDKIEDSGNKLSLIDEITKNIKKEDGENILKMLKEQESLLKPGLRKALFIKAILGLEKGVIKNRGIESKEKGYDKVMRSLNIAVSKRENFKKLLDKVFNKVGKDQFGKLVETISKKHGTSDDRDILIDLIKSEALDEKNIDTVLGKIKKGEKLKEAIKTEKEIKEEKEKKQKEIEKKEKFNITQLAEYFNIDKNKAENLSKELIKIGLDATIFLNKYKNFINKKLSGLDEKYLDKIKLSIGRKFLKLDINKIVNDNVGGLEKGESIKNARWIINDILKSNFDFIDNQVFPTAQILIKEKSGKLNISGREESLYNVSDKLKEAKKMFESEVLENGDFDKTWRSGELLDANTNIWNIFDTGTTTATLTNKGIDSQYLKASERQELFEGADLLNETDKKIEKDSMMKMMALILSMAGGSLATGPIGALADMGYNAVDFWKNEDLAITMLKQLPQPYGIPKEFHMRKTILDNIGAFLGMIPLLGPAAKVAKVGKLAAKYGLKMSEITELSKVIGKEMASLHKSENIHNVKFQETVNNVVLSKIVEGKGAKFGEHGSEVKKIADLSKDIDILKLGKIKEGEKYNINGENYTVIKDNKKLVFKSKKTGDLFIIDKNQAGKDFLVKLDNSGNIIKNNDSATAIKNVKKVEKEIITKKQVNKNALLTNEQRTDKAQELLGGKKLSQEENDAIIKAHEVGKDREGASVFNYTNKEIAEKSKILKEAGFSHKEVVALMDNGIVGKVGDNNILGKVGETVKIAGEEIAVFTGDTIDGALKYLKSLPGNIDFKNILKKFLPNLNDNQLYVVKKRMEIVEDGENLTKKIDIPVVATINGKTVYPFEKDGYVFLRTNLEKSKDDYTIKNFGNGTEVDGLKRMTVGEFNKKNNFGKIDRMGNFNGYEMGQKVKLKRRSGEIQEGKVVAFKKETNQIQVEFDIDGKNATKWVKKESLDDVNKLNINPKVEKFIKSFKQGEEVSVVVRGKEIKGKIIGNNIENGGTLKIRDSKGYEYKISGDELISVKRLKTEAKLGGEIKNINKPEKIIDNNIPSIIDVKKLPNYIDDAPGITGKYPDQKGINTFFYNEVSGNKLSKDMLNSVVDTLYNIKNGENQINLKFLLPDGKYNKEIIEKFVKKLKIELGDDLKKYDISRIDEGKIFIKNEFRKVGNFDNIASWRKEEIKDGFQIKMTDGEVLKVGNSEIFSNSKGNIFVGNEELEEGGSGFILTHNEESYLVSKKDGKLKFEKYNDEEYFED